MKTRITILIIAIVNMVAVGITAVTYDYLYTFATIPFTLLALFVVLWYSEKREKRLKTANYYHHIAKIQVKYTTMGSEHIPVFYTYGSLNKIICTEIVEKLIERDLIKIESSPISEYQEELTAELNIVIDKFDLKQYTGYLNIEKSTPLN